jgi:hypothetical protein
MKSMSLFDSPAYLAEPLLVSNKMVSKFMLSSSLPMKIDVYPYFFLQAQNKIIQIIQGITILVICIEIHQDLSVHVKLKVQSILQENL